MNTRAITFRLAARCAGISLLVCIGFGLYTYLGLRDYLRRSQADTLHRRAHQIAAIVAVHAVREGDAFAIDLIKTSYAPELDDRFIRVRRPDDSVLYASGLSAHRSFDPSARADEVRTHSENGAGLGLSIMRSICLAHGGVVEAANRPEGGCRITVPLPAGVPSASRPTATARTSVSAGKELPVQSPLVFSKL